MPEDVVELAQAELLKVWLERVAEQSATTPEEHCRAFAESLAEAGLLRNGGVEWGVFLHSSVVMPVTPNTYTEARRYAKVHDGEVVQRYAAGPWTPWEGD